MSLFQDHEGERVIMQCSDNDLKIDGYIIGLQDNCVHISSGPDGKGTHKFVPWPNPNIVSLEFISKNTVGGIY